MVNDASVVLPLLTVTVWLALTLPEVVMMPCVVLPSEASMRPPIPKKLVPLM